MSKVIEAEAPAAPSGGSLIVINNTAGCVITFGSLHAQTTAGPNAPVLIHHKEAYMAYSNPGVTLEYTNYVSAIPSINALQWWMVTASGTSTQETSAYVQSTYGNPFWAGAHITAKYSGSEMYQTGGTYRNTVGDPTLGNFNQTIIFNEPNSNVNCIGTWSYDQPNNTWYITFTQA